MIYGPKDHIYHASLMVIMIVPTECKNGRHEKNVDKLIHLKLAGLQATDTNRFDTS